MGDVVRPSGVVTFLFTDIEGSTRRWEDDPDGMRQALTAHDEALRSAIEAQGGWLFKHTGDGVCAAFKSPGAAVEAAVKSQRGLELPVRMGIATGEAELRGEDYFGPALNRAARVMDAGHGGQILVSSVAAGLVDDVDLLDLGPRQLRDLSEPEQLFQVCGEGLSLEFPPLRTLDATPGNLRPQRSSFVGRQSELAAVIEALASHRMVSLTGVGGVGKTRLALQVAAEVAPDFPEGVWFVELASVGDPDAVPEALATLLGISQQPGLTVTESLAAALAGRLRLLVFDNCEHVIDAAGDVIEAILDRSRTVKVLATSREGLGLPDEHLWPVPSLDVASECVALFADRSQALGLELSLDDPDQLQTIQDICSRLDGIPLAIELASSRTVSMTTDEIRDRLDDRFRLLTGSRRGLERHQTLHNAVSWSYDLLTPEEQVMLDRCSVFAGGFDLDAAVAVAGRDLDEFAVLDRLDSVVRKSLLTADRSGAKTRYSMLETIRQFAEAQLGQGGDGAEIRTLHARYFARGLEEVWHAAIEGTEQLVAFSWIEEEIANLRAAFRWAAELPDLETSGTIAAGGALLGSQVAELEPIGWCEELLEAARAERHHLLGRLLIGAAMCVNTGRLDDFLAYAEEGVPLFEDPHYERHYIGTGPSMFFAGYLYLGQPDKAVELCQADIALLEDPPVILRAGLVYSLTVAHKAEEARAASADLVELAERGANPTDLANAYLAFALPRFSTDPMAAMAACRRSLEVASATRNRIVGSGAGMTLARLELQHGDSDVALRLLADVLQGHLDAGEVQALKSPLALVAAKLSDSGRLEAAATVAGYAADELTLSLYAELAEAIENGQAALGEAEYAALAEEGAGMEGAAIVRFAQEQIDQGVALSVPTPGLAGALTTRQLEVTQLVARGLSNKDIAKRLDVSPYTVETHVRNILERLDATNRTQIVAWVIANQQD